MMDIQTLSDEEFEKMKAEQEKRKSQMYSWSPKIARKKPVPVKKQLAMQKEEIRNKLLERLRWQRRNCPKDWHKGYNWAMSEVEVLFDELE